MRRAERRLHDRVPAAGLALQRLQPRHERACRHRRRAVADGRRPRRRVRRDVGAEGVDPRVLLQIDPDDGRGAGARDRRLGGRLEERAPQDEGAVAREDAQPRRREDGLARAQRHGGQVDRERLGRQDVVVDERRHRHRHRHVVRARDVLGAERGADDRRPRRRRDVRRADAVDERARDGAVGRRRLPPHLRRPLVAHQRDHELERLRRAERRLGRP